MVYGVASWVIVYITSYLTENDTAAYNISRELIFNDITLLSEVTKLVHRMAAILYKEITLIRIKAFLTS